MTENQLRERHGVLVDKKFTEGLTPEETAELAEINLMLDDLEMVYTVMVMRHLLNNIRTRSHGRE